MKRLSILIGVLLLALVGFFFGGRWCESLFAAVLHREGGRMDRRMGELNKSVVMRRGSDVNTYIKGVEGRLGIDLVEQLDSYGIDSEKIAWKIGGRGPDVGWLLEPPRLNLGEIVRLSTPLDDQKESFLIRNRDQAREQAMRYRSVTAGQVWLGYEDDDYYYFAGGDVLPNFDFSVGTVIEKKTGSVRYWFAQDLNHAARPILQKRKVNKSGNQ